jgi:hypothetical protein
MRQRVYSRIEGLEKIAAVRRAKNTRDISSALQRLHARAEALFNDPEHQKRIAEMPPEVLRERVQEFRQALWERAHGNQRGSAA